MMQRVGKLLAIAALAVAGFVILEQSEQIRQLRYKNEHLEKEQVVNEIRNGTIDLMLAEFLIAQKVKLESERKFVNSLMGVGFSPNQQRQTLARYRRFVDGQEKLTLKYGKLLMHALEIRQAVPDKQ